MVGALATGLLLIPWFGLARSLLALATLLAVGAVLTTCRGRRRVAAILAIGALAATGLYWGEHGQYRIVESLYGELEIRHSELADTLLIDGLPQTGLPKQLAP